MAPEPAAPRFGAAHQLVATFATGGSNGASLSYQQFDHSQATYLTASAEVGLDYFVVQNVSIGFDVSASYADSQGYGADGSLVEGKSSALSGGARFGVNVPLGERFSLYPRLTLGVQGSRLSQGVVSGQADTVGNVVGAPTTSSVGPWVNAFVPLLFHATPHFFLGVGPRFVHRFADATGSPTGASAQSTTIDAAFVLGGTFGGDGTPRDGTPAAPAPARLRRFGDYGTFVITGETDGFLYGTSYAGTPASRSGFYVRPGFDVFLADHFSLGLDVSVGRTHEVNLTTSGALDTYDSTSFGVAPRAGLEIPIGASVSFYPRGEVGFGSTSQNESSAGASNDHTSTELWVSLEAPLLVHVARHFFAGMGPWVTHDLDNTDQYAYTNLGTTVGVSALLGGWM